MPTVVNTNMASLYAQNNLTNAQNSLATSVQRLSSGLRINSAKDDAAGLAIAQNMQSQINGTNQSVQNLSDATNLLQTADSSLSTIQDMLLRLKQLATQGYDGSLNGSQKLDILQQMNDLNTEINQTATRTQFNGINLLTSGSSIDLVNSGIQIGSTLTATPTTVDRSTTTGLGIFSTGGASAAIGLADGAQTGGTASTFAIVLDSTKANYNPGSYTLSANGNQLTLTGSYQGLSQSQTVTVQDVNAIDSNNPITSTQALNFSNFGVQLNVTSTVIAGTNQTGSNIAAKFGTVPYKSLVINGSNATVSNVTLNGVAPATYTITAGAGLTGTSAQTVGVGMTAGTYVVKLTDATTATAIGGHATVVVSNAGTIGSITLSGGAGYVSGDNLTIAASALGSGSSAVTVALGATNINTVAMGSLNIAGTVNGVSTNQAVALTDLAAQGSESVNFGSFGISMNVVNNGNGTMTAKSIGGLLAGLTNSSQTAAGQFVVGTGNNSNLQFQSGATSASFININTLNVQTGSTGATAGSSNQMMSVGTAITSSASGYLGGLTAGSTIAQWQAAFQNAAAAIDGAVDYISTQRATFGSQINRLSYISTNLTAQSTNLQQSKSAIMDTNFASETAILTKGQIMQQAATAMLAQANQMPNVILSLLK